jgi:ADP-ribose pyrophosphatase YjhB (NUDIX family)
VEETYGYAIVAVSAFVKKENSVLLVKRGKEPGKNLWAFPGGRVRKGERLVEAVKRELYEETGVEAEPTGIIAVTEVITKTNNHASYHYVILTFAFKEETIHGDPKPGGDVAEAKWVPIQKAIEMPDVVYSVRRILESQKPPLLNVITLE